MTLTDNSLGVHGSQQTVGLTGTGLPVPVAQATVAPLAVTFLQTTVATSAPAQTISISNSGSAPLLLGMFVLSETADFSLTSDCGTSLAPGTSCNLIIGFQPESAGDLQASLTLSDNSGGGGLGGAQQTVLITGKGVAPPAGQASLDRSSLIFPVTVTNTVAMPMTVTLTNTGPASLVISSISITGSSAAAFTLASAGCGSTLAAGASCVESVLYAPTLASTANTATLTFTDNSGGIAGAGQAVSLTGTALAEIDSVTNYGDSITCGFYAQPADGVGNVYSEEGYAGILDSFIGAPAENDCRQGDTAADVSRLFVPFSSTPTVSGNQLYTLMIGVNDAYRYGIPPVALNNYAEEVGAALAWLALPGDAKVLANSITQRTGLWTADTGYGVNDFGLNSADPGASLTFAVNQAEAGHQLYVVYHVYDLPAASAGMASIAVDGVTEATVDESVNSGLYPETQNGTDDTYFLQVVPLGAVGSHTVTFTSAGLPGAKVSLLWAGVPQARYPSLNGAPRVLVGAITTSPSGNQAYVASVYTARLRTLVSSLAADGMNVSVVPTDSVLDPGSDFADLLHPNNTGHAKLAAAFEQYR